MSNVVTMPQGNRGKGRPTILSDPNKLRLVAELFASGATRDKICEEMNVSDPGTVTRWRRDPRVQALVRKLIQDRVVRISTKVDSQIEARLQHADRLSIRELIEIRKEFGGDAVARQHVADNETINSAIDAVQDDPELADKLIELLQKQPAEAE